jgi:hypothetical protein
VSPATRQSHSAPFMPPYSGQALPTLQAAKARGIPVKSADDTNVPSRRDAACQQLRVLENLAAKDDPLRCSQLVDVLAWIVVVHYRVSRAALLES